VRTPADLSACDALIIPGGESTTIALLARINGLLDPLRDFVKNKPVWVTCAGAILLAQGGVEGAKKGGQEIIGGFDVKVERNGWGSQLESFEQDLTVPDLSNPNKSFKGVFIRAPVVLALVEPSGSSRPPIHILSRLESHHSFSEDTDFDCINSPKGIVAARQGHHLLTTFHPELTNDHRFHEYFVKHCVLDSALPGSS